MTAITPIMLTVTEGIRGEEETRVLRDSFKSTKILCCNVKTQERKRVKEEGKDVETHQIIILLEQTVYEGANCKPCYLCLSTQPSAFHTGEEDN